MAGVERGLRIGLGAVALCGLAVSAYLTYERAVGGAPACVVGQGCATVQRSQYSEVAGVPVAVLGLIAYGLLLAAALLPGTPGRALGLFTAGVGVAFSAWLTYAELFLIDAVCAWCVTSAILMVAALALAGLRALRDRAPAGEGPPDAVSSRPRPGSPAGRGSAPPG